MPRLKKNVAPLIDRAIDSLTLSIELFNRPAETGRHHSVLILMQHAFEMLLKAAILQRTGTIHAKGEKYTYGFDKCLAIMSQKLKILEEDERATLSILDAQRDQAAHYYIDISEDVLYVHAQSGVTLFDELLSRTFSRRLADSLPSRVLPVSTKPPRDLALLLGNELAEVDRLLAAGKRQGAQAAAKLRTILAFTSGARNDDGERVTESQIAAAIGKRRRKQDWSLILPEIAQLTLSTDGTGIPISMRLAKDARLSFKVARPGDTIEGTLLKQEIDPWTVFTMGREDLAKKLGITGPKTHALIYELGIQSDERCYRELRRKSQVFKGYSMHALTKLKEALQTLSIDEVWARHRTKLGNAKAKSKPG